MRFGLTFQCRVPTPTAGAEKSHARAQAAGQDAVATIPGRGYRFAMQRKEDKTPAPIAAPPQAPVRTDLPHALEALFGRAEDLEQLDRLLASHRMLTVLGAGGIGKTRVAQALARTVSARFTHGVWWVDWAR